MRSSISGLASAHILSGERQKGWLHRALKPTFCHLDAWGGTEARMRHMQCNRTWGQRGTTQTRHALTCGPLFLAGLLEVLAGRPTWKIMKTADGKDISAPPMLLVVIDVVATSRSRPGRFPPRAATTPEASATPFSLNSDAVYQVFGIKPWCPLPVHAPAATSPRRARAERPQTAITEGFRSRRSAEVRVCVSPSR